MISAEEPIRAEVALGRVLSYLQLAGMSVTPAVERQALEVVLKGLEDADSASFEKCMGLARERFHLQHEIAPVAAPPLRRGSIGYGDH